jgi:DNA-directed RNA polymerases I, II, and III subunit RPABC2
MSLVPTDDIQKVRAADRSLYRSLPFMTKYEFNQLVSLRTLHLAKGAPPLVELPENFTAKTNMELRTIALRELKEKKMPYIVKRPMPNGKTEYWRVDELDLVAVQHLFRDG